MLSDSPFIHRINFRRRSRTVPRDRDLFRQARGYQAHTSNVEWEEAK
jgi:hypothetical protein